MVLNVTPPPPSRLPPSTYGLRSRLRSLPRWGRRTFWWSLVVLFVACAASFAVALPGIQRDQARQTCTRIWGPGTWFSHTGTVADRLAVMAVIDNCVLDMTGDPAAEDQGDFAARTAAGLRRP